MANPFLSEKREELGANTTLNAFPQICHYALVLRLDFSVYLKVWPHSLNIP